MVAKKMFLIMAALLVAREAGAVEAPRVFDSKGKFIGVLAGRPTGDACPENVLRPQGGTLVALGVGRERIVPCSGAVFLHDTTDCSGRRYLEVTKFDLARRAHVDATTAYYPTDPLALM